MAAVVGAFGVPHVPMAPGMRATDPASQWVRHYASVRACVDAVEPDVVIMFDTDHFHHWSHDRLPAFAVGVAERSSGPGTDDWPGEARFEHIPVDEPLARHLYRFGLSAEFDLTISEEFELDHSITVPVHFLDATDGVVVRPIVPVWINGIAPPFPLARRCRDLGAMVARAVVAYPPDLRVAIVASGSISGEIGGPHSAPGSPGGVPDEAWLGEFAGLMNEARLDELVSAATPERLGNAGNVTGECLNWIALLGAIGPRPPTFLEVDTPRGNAFAAWDLR